jgi:hypothetical protein
MSTAWDPIPAGPILLQSNAWAAILIPVDEDDTGLFQRLSNLFDVAGCS